MTQEQNMEKVKLSPWMPEGNPMVLRRMGKTIEEMAEAIKVMARIVIQGLDGVDPASGSPNLDELEKELADVQAQICFNIDKLHLDSSSIVVRRYAKIDQMVVWEAMVEDKDKTWPLH